MKRRKEQDVPFRKGMTSMEFIIGGSHQGKRAYGKKQRASGLICYLDGATCLEEEVLSCEGIYNFHLLIRRTMESSKNQSIEVWERVWEEYINKLFKENPNIIIISDEIGGGIVPIDKFERMYREITGRVGCMIAKKSNRVVRVFCGIGTVMKEDGHTIYSSWEDEGK